MWSKRFVYIGSVYRYTLDTWMYIGNMDVHWKHGCGAQVDVHWKHGCGAQIDVHWKHGCGAQVDVHWKHGCTLETWM